MFDHTLAAGRDDVVLCHLNHRLVQMCLRFTSGNLVAGQAKKLHRFTTRMVPDTVLRTPAVLIHGRLLVLGETITASTRDHRCRWHLREGRFSRMNVGETQAAAVGQQRPRAERSRESAHGVVAKSRKSGAASARARMQDRTKNLQKFLDDRAEREVANVTAVIQELERSIRETLADKEARN